MATCRFKFSPDYAVPPGETLREILDDRRVAPAELARQTDLTVEQVRQILTGEVPLSHDVALRIDQVTDVPHRFWMNLESNYQERRAHLAEMVTSESDLTMLNELPITAMVKLGILTKDLNRAHRLREALRFLGVANRHAWTEKLNGLQASFRITGGVTPTLRQRRSGCGWGRSRRQPSIVRLGTR